MRFPSPVSFSRQAHLSFYHWTLRQVSLWCVFAAAFILQAANGATDVWSSNFEGHEAGANLDEWLDTADGSSTNAADGSFTVFDLGGELALGTESELMNIHSHLQGAQDVLSLSAYEFRGRLLINDSNGGVGVTVFSDYPNSDTYYRLRRYGSQASFQLSHHGSNLSGQLDTGVTPLANVWYQFAVRVEDSGDETIVSAKVWAEGQEEPSSWQAEGRSSGASRIMSGTVGLWSFGSGGKFWDDLRVVSDAEGGDEGGSNPVEVVVPDLGGLDLESAESVLSELGLVVGSLSFESSAEVDSVSVVGQTPAAGQAVGDGASVALELLRPLVAGAKSMALTWEDNSTNEEGFEIERAQVGEDFGLLSSVEANSEAFVDESVVPGLEYQYRVRAFNAFGYSGYTNVSIGSIPNTAPVLGAIEDVSVLKGESIPSVPFSIADAESDVSNLTVETLSSNLELLPLEAISVQVGEGEGTLTLQPAVAATGQTTVTLMVSDGVEVAQQSFNFEVIKNLAPTIGTIRAVEAYESESIGPIEFSVSDSETDKSSLSVSGLSMDESLIASDSIRIGGSGASRTISFETKAAASGSTTIRIAVSDGVNTTYGALQVAVAKNLAPTIGELERVEALAGQAVVPVAFSVADFETAASELAVSAISLDEGLIASSSIVLGGAGASRTVEFSTREGASGLGTIRLSVSDGAKSSVADLQVNVSENTAPEISGLGSLYTMEVGGSLDSLPFVVSDSESASRDLIVSVRSSDQAIVPDSGLVLEGEEDARILDVSPRSEVSGSAQITVTVSDGQKSVEHSFTLRIRGEEQMLTLLDFEIVNGLAVVEVEALEGLEYSLWKIGSADGVWREVSDAEVILGEFSVTLIDPTPVGAAVCYRVAGVEQ